MAMKSWVFPMRRLTGSMSLGLAITLILSVTQSVVAPTTAQAADSACPATNYLPNTSSYPIFDISSQFSSYMKSDGVYYKVNKVSGEAMAVGMDHSIVSNLVVPETVTVTSSMIQAAGFDSTNSNCVAFAKEYKVRYIGTDAFQTKTGVTFPVLSSVTINAKLKSIAKYAFGGQCKVGALVIPDAVTDIGEGAFNFMNTTTGNPNCAGSTGLQSITLGINLKRMWMSTFQATSNLTSITFRGQVFTTTNSNNELDYPSSYDLFGFPGQFPGSRIQNTCREIFPYVTASVSVLAGSAAGWSAWAGVNSCLDPSSSYSQTITTAPSKIATPVASNPTQSSAQVAFTAPFNGGSAITGYRVTSVPGGFTATLNGALADTVTVTGLSAATDYKFFVVAINANGDSSESELSNQITTSSLTVPALTLSAASETVAVGSSIAGYSITNSGGAATSYSISPSETNTPGLSFNTSTGLITGVPTMVASGRTYTISASNGAGSSTTNGSFTIAVVAAQSSSPTQSNSVPSPPNVQPESTMKLVATFYFPLNSYLVNAANRRAIVGAAERIMSSSAKTVLIYGNTDSQGGVDNVWLSKQRAAAVRKVLRPRLSGKKIQLGWFADTRPAVKGKSKAAYAKNRRVEIWVK